MLTLITIARHMIQPGMGLHRKLMLSVEIKINAVLLTRLLCMDSFKVPLNCQVIVYVD